MKIVVIGAGSHVFVLTVLADAIEKHRMDGLQLALVDVDAQAAETMATLARRMAQDLGVRATAESFTDRRLALPGADFVIPCVHVPFHGTADERRRRNENLRQAADGRIDWRPLLRESPSWEHPVDVAVALGTRQPLRVDMLNLANQGSLPQLPRDRIVEVPAQALADRMVGCGPLMLPEPTAAICRAVSDVHELVATGAALGDVGALEEAIERDPAVPDKRAGRAMLPRLVAAHADIKPQFQGF